MASSMNANLPRTRRSTSASDSPGSTDSRLTPTSNRWLSGADASTLATVSIASRLDTISEAESERLDRRNARRGVRSQVARARVVRYAQVNDVPARQAQMYNTFLQLHFGSDAAKADMVSRRSYLLALPDWDLFSAPLLRHAIFTVCFAHLGVVHQNTRLIQESQVSYGRVLRALGQELAREPEQQDPNIIIPSIMLLTLYDDPLPSPQSQRSGWAAHYEGVLSYIRARGPTFVDISSPSHRLLFTNLRVPSIFIGLAKRKGAIMGAPDWLDLMRNNRLQSRPRAIFYDMLLSIPRLLETTEDLIQDEFDEMATVNLCGQVVKMQTSLHKWLNMSSSVAGQFLRELELSVVHISDRDQFNLAIEEQLVMSTNTTFYSFYNLRGERRNEEMSMYWMVCLILDCTLLRILHNRPQMSTHISDDIQASLLNDALSHARSLCRLVYKLCQSDSQGDTAYVQLLLALSKNYFEEIGAVKEAGWCQAVGIASDMRMERLRKSQPRTLCRMGDLISDISSLASFKSRHEGTISQALQTSSSPSPRKCPFDHG